MIDDRDYNGSFEEGLNDEQNSEQGLSEELIYVLLFVKFAPIAGIAINLLHCFEGDIGWSLLQVAIGIGAQYVLSRLWANVELSLLGLLKPTLFAIFYSIFWFWIFSLYA